MEECRMQPSLRLYNVVPLFFSMKPIFIWNVAHRPAIAVFNFATRWKSTLGTDLIPTTMCQA